MASFPAREFKRMFMHFFENTPLHDIFMDMIQILDDELDPWKSIQKLRLRLYEFDDEEFDINDWLINAGMFITILKQYIMAPQGFSRENLNRMVDWFHENLEKSMNDFLDDEIPFIYSFLFNNEFMRYMALDHLDPGDIQGLKAFINYQFDEMDSLIQFARVKSFSLVLPFFLDLVMIHESQCEEIIPFIEKVISKLESDSSAIDEARGLCARTLAFRDYDTASHPALHELAREMSESIIDPFISMTAQMHVSIGDAIRGNREHAMQSMTKLLVDNYHMPTPKKEINIAFLTRGTIEARLEKMKIHEDMRSILDEILENTVDTIFNINQQFNSDAELDDDEFKDLVNLLEVSFTIISALVDNLSIAGVHTSQKEWIIFCEDIIDKINEVNLVMKFKSRFMVYHAKIDAMSMKPVLHHAERLVAMLKEEIENLYFDEVVDFFTEFSRSILELVSVVDDGGLFKHLKEALNIARNQKFMEPMGENDAFTDMDTVNYQVLAAMNAVISERWNAFFSLNLLQGYSFSGFD
ncbi:hypothetical protein GF325_02165 [Candidatus Bathyarchaeota archaeon]|nr:hypothetical protein [Candidatus Bathyarchaeota archaeon]